MKNFGEILLISCYELGHQPMGISMPLGFLQRAGYLPDIIDLSVDRLDHQKISRARFIGISVPMHTALRLGARVAGEVRKVKPDAHICFFGLYASLNAEYLLAHGADSTIGGEFETPLVELINALLKEGISQIKGVSFKKPYFPSLSGAPFVWTARPNAASAASSLRRARTKRKTTDRRICRNQPGVPAYLFTLPHYPCL
ncbi:MAG: cobalamin B12-binding domain-containing protein [Nitrospirae bacterium]|nr:cobalamin B12-binding domain-containing protein [Nitrospirota bacterium]